MVGPHVGFPSRSLPRFTRQLGSLYTQQAEADGINWFLRSVRPHLTDFSFYGLPKQSQPQLVACRTANAVVPCARAMGVFLKSVRDKAKARSTYEFRHLPHSDNSRGVFVGMCPQKNLVWIDRRSAFRGLHLNLVEKDAVTPEVAADVFRRVYKEAEVDSNESDENVHLLPKLQWIRESVRNQPHRIRGRELLFQAMQLPVLNELQFPVTEPRWCFYNASLRGHRILYRILTSGDLVQISKYRDYKRLCMESDTEFDAVLVLAARDAGSPVLSRIGLLPKSVLLAGRASYDRLQIYIKRTGRFDGTSLAGFEDHFLDVAEAGAEDFENFFERILPAHGDIDGAKANSDRACAQAESSLVS